VKDRPKQDRAPLDLQALAKDEETLETIAAGIEDTKDSRPARLWTEEFSASGEKQGGM
jgi:hypothetical protein